VIHHRLPAMLAQIQDGEAPVPQPDAGPGPHTLPVRATMRERPRHRPHQPIVHWPGGISVVEDARYAAHGQDHPSGVVAALPSLPVQ
jgi:hypothetical protein